MHRPKTRKEAEQLKYLRWVVREEIFNPDCCAYSLFRGEQCHRDPGFGPDGLYCKRHGKMVKS